MGNFGLALLAVAVTGIPFAIMLYTNSNKKRGCGGGCAICGNRNLCHRGENNNSKKAP